jgi:hypothetical protein
MIKHQEKHPGLDVPGCFGCKAAHVSVPASATPSRRAGASHARWVNDTEKRWHKDMDAYRRLVRDGLQPPKIDGCAEVEKRAETKSEVESGRVKISG